MILFLIGKFDMAPDNYLMQLIRNPQQIDIGRGIEPFSDETLRESFSLQQGRIPEVSYIMTLLGEIQQEIITQLDLPTFPLV
jgi:hypothetical protein